MDQRPLEPQHILSFLRAHARNQPDRIMVHAPAVPGGRAVCYRQAWQQVCGQAAWLARRGVRPPGVVLVFLPQGWLAISAYLGAIALGCTASFMPLPSAKQDPDRYWAAHAALVQRITPVAIVAAAAYETAIHHHGLVLPGSMFVRADAAGHGEDLPGGVADDWPLVISDWPPVLQHSSGTTGLKKGVQLSHAAIIAQVQAYADAICATRRDVVVSWLPLYHDMGLVACLLMPMLLGQTIVLLDPYRWVSRPTALFDAITRHGGTLCWLPNFAFEHLARLVEPDQARFRLDSMRAFINCSEPCHAATFQRFAAAFSPIGLGEKALQVCYAMAETTFAVTQTDLDRTWRTLHADPRALQEGGRFHPAEAGDANAVQLISAGSPIAGTVISIHDPRGAELQSGMVGEIYVRSASLFTGYFRQEAETTERLHAGIYRTRDRGFLQDGELYVLGRVDDLIILAGRNFHAAEIEAVVNGVPGLKPGRNIAFGVQSAERGTAELVIVAEADPPGEAAAEHALRHGVRETIMQHFAVAPGVVVIVRPGWLQKTTSGKIERKANIARYLLDRVTPHEVQVLSLG